MSKKSTKAGVFGAILGAIAGVFLLAPKGARENRKDFKDATLKAKAESEKKLKELHTELSAKLDDVTKKGKAKAGTEREKLIKRAEDVKVKLRSALSELHEGNEDIKTDLKKLVTDSKTVIDKLKQTLKK